MIIAHNLVGEFNHRIIKNINNRSSKSMEKLSSGLRINRASDDAAGLSISEKLRGQIRGLSQAGRNIQDGISLIHTAEGAMAEITSFLQRARELSVQAANDTYTLDDRRMIQKEIDEILKGIDNIVENTEFNAIKLLNGSNPHPSIEGPTQTIEFDYANVLSSTPVGSNGNFTFATNQGYPTTIADINKTLVFGTGGTSYPAVRIGDTSFLLSNHVSQQTIIENGAHKTVFTVGAENVQVIQTVKIVQDKYEIKYTMINNSGEDKEIGMFFHIDTMLGNDDRAPFIVNDAIITNETVFIGSDIPDSFIVYNQNTGSGSNAELQAHGILRGEGIIEEPSKFGIGQYYRVSNWNWSPSGLVGDSGYSIWWNPRTVAAGERFEVNTFYGLSVPPTIEDPNSITEFVGPFDLQLQVGSNQGNQFKITLPDLRLHKLEVNNSSVVSREVAVQSIGRFDTAIQKVSSHRSQFGAYQNGLQHTLSNVLNTEENLQAAESRITDADIAKEVMELTKLNILQQATFSMLAQANQAPQGILQLLR